MQQFHLLKFLHSIKKIKNTDCKFNLLCHLLNDSVKCRETLLIYSKIQKILLGYISSQASIKCAKPENFICGHFNLSCCTKAKNKYMLPNPVPEITDNNQDFPILSSLGFV